MGNTFSPQAAQCGQLIEAYSVIVTAAFGEPMATSGSVTGFATCAAMALCASAAGAGQQTIAAIARTRAKQKLRQPIIDDPAGPWPSGKTCARVGKSGQPGVPAPAQASHRD